MLTVLLWLIALGYFLTEDKEMTKLIQFKKALAVTLAVLMVLTTLPGGLLKAKAADSDKTTLDIGKGNIKIGNGTVDGYDSSGNHVTTANSNGYIITQSGNGTSGNFLKVNGGNQNITLRNVNICEPKDGTSTYHGLSIRDSKTTLTVSGNNSLRGGGGCLGISVYSGASLVIDGGETDSLTATGESEPGIGSPFGNGGGDVTINGGKITAVGSENSAGIGGHTSSQCNNVTINGGVVTAYGSGGGAGIGGGGGNPTYEDGGSGGNVKINGGTVTATGSNGSCGIGGGAGCSGVLAASGSITITGGSVNASIQSTPANVGGTPLYRTVVSVPSGTDVKSLAIQQSGSNYTYGYKDMQMQTDGASYGKLYLWLPANTGNQETTASVSTDNSNVYSGYHHTVDNSNNSVLKMDQRLTIQSVLASYTYNPTGSLFTPTVTGGAADITGSITYSGTNSVNGAVTTGSSIQPTDVGSYTVTATKAENAAWYSGSTSRNFSIEPEDLSDDSRITVGNIPNQLYDAKEAATPAVTIKDSNIGIDSSYYSVSYLNNTGIALSNGENPPTAKIDGSGNYRGTVYARFTIESAPTISVSGNLGDWATQVELTVSARAGSSGIGSVTVQKGTDMPTDITTNKNYMVTENGSYTFTVTSNSGFTDFQTVQMDKIDSAAPAVGNISGNPESPVQSAALSLTVVPGESGIRSVTVSRYGNGQWTVLTDASIADIKNANDSHTYIYTTTGNGTYKFTVTSVASVSADSDSVDVTKIDTAKPTVSIDSNGYNDGDWTKDDVTLNISNKSSNLGTTTYEYSTDGGYTWMPFEGSVTDTDEGVKSYQFYATSASGVVSEIQSITVKIDKTAPTEMVIGFKQNPFKTVANFLTFGIFFGDTVDVNFSAADNGSNIDHYEYQTVAEGGATGTWQAGALSISPKFKGTVYARAVDKAGNTSGTVTKSLVVDKTAPTIAANNGGTVLNTTNKNASIPVTVTDNGAGVGRVTYQVNNTMHSVDLTDTGYNDVTNTYSFNIRNLPDGSYDVVVNAQDNSGNNAQTATVHVTQNTQPTVTNISVTPGSAVFNHGDTQQFTASVTGTNLTEATSCVAWSVSGNRSSGTSIDENGTLTVASDEAATSLIVTATSVNNSTVNGQATVNINISSQTGFGFSSDSIIKTTTDAEFTILASGGQGDGIVTYALTGGNGVVSLDGNKVTPLKVGTAVITATKVADGSFSQVTATLTLNVGKGTTTVTTLPTTSEINAVGKLSSCKLTGGSADVPGSFVWTNPNTIVTESGTYEATFTPAETTDYNSRTCMVKVVVNPVIRDNGSDVAFDLTGVTLPDAVTSVSVGSSVQPKLNGDSAYSVVENQIGSREKLDGLTVYNLRLLDQNSNPIENFTGKITVRIPIPSGMSGDLHVYWYNDADSTVTDMNARQENGYLVFETTHFSYYAVAELGEKSSTDSGTIPNPDTGGNPFPYIPAALLGITGCGLAAVAKGRRFRKKN